jgi:hypothetical protein
MNTSTMTESDWAAILDEAASPSTAKPPSHAPPPATLATADAIVAEEQRKADAHHAETTIRGAATVPRATGILPRRTPPTTGAALAFADDVAPVASTDSPELIELRGIHAELRALGAMLAVAINKLPARRG